jgi:hypothetical protein
MRLGKFLTISSLLTAATIFTGSALADGDFDASGGSGSATITAHSGWHVNPNYPWKITIGGKKFDKSSFSFNGATATATGLPAGSGHFKGGICSSDDQNGGCQKIEGDVNIQ